MIKAIDITKSFPIPGKIGQEFYALKGISMEIPDQSLAILKGKSGSGKTTLLNIMSALDQPSSGQVWYDELNVTEIPESKKEALRRQKLGFVFQSVSLLPLLSAYENVEFSLRMAKLTEYRKERAEEVLRMVGLENRMHHMPQELSGGEQQRVAIARALAHKPQIIFADEPTGELDSATALSVIKLFQKLVEKEGIIILMTTHDPGLMGAGDFVFELQDGELV